MPGSNSEIKATVYRIVACSEAHISSLPLICLSNIQTVIPFWLSIKTPSLRIIKQQVHFFAWDNACWNKERKENGTTHVWAALLVMTDTYSATVGSGDLFSWARRGNSSDDRRKRLQTAWSHILRKAKSTILRGDSFWVCPLLGLSALAE